ncbi:hypothetical protein [Deinococcus hopiensis]|uniref:Uncharacterized protein n=1 Tax=Deinococcus hopiensis KR-140 TaxID=695939 RepID=A0A1W1UXV2_9DEIO|nr:hypothetical protein [Deinococcus hopiensis]SMB85935.1 hypothetical protein SAMN00790413_03610 [Deinococcus hopiensis KR-140]
MTMMHLPTSVQAAVRAAQELREAKQFLRSGHLIKGVQRQDRAKRELYQAVQGLMQSEQTQTPIQKSFDPFVMALEDYQTAYDQRQADSTNGPAALALVKAVKKVIGELDRLEQVLN